MDQKDCLIVSSGKGMRLLFALLCGGLLVFFPVSAQAEESLTGPLDLQSMVDKALSPVEKSNQSLDDYQKMLEEADGGLMAETLAGLISHPWPITRALVWGITGGDGAVGRMRDGTVEKRVVGVERTSFVHKSKAGAGSKERLSRSQMVRKQKWQTFVDAVDETVAVEEITKGLFNRTRVIGFILAGVFVSLQLMLLTFRTLTGTPQGISEHGFPPALRTLTQFCTACFGMFLIPGLIHLIIYASHLISLIMIGPENLPTLGEKMTQAAWAQAQIAGLANDWTMWDWIKNTLSQAAGSVIGSVFFWLSSAILYVILTLGDVMLGISAVIGPIVIALSLVPGFENYFKRWLSSVFVFAKYAPICMLYCLVCVVLMTSIPVLGLKGYIVMSFAMLLVAVSIPNMASELSAAAMGSTATTMAGMSNRLLGKLVGRAFSRS